MAQANLRTRLETFIVVSLITVLVWLYAEGESVKSYTNQSVAIRFVTPGENEDVQIRPSTEQRVLISFRGSRGQSQALEALLQKGPIAIPVVASPDDTATNIVLKDKLNSELADLGIEVQTVEPAAIPVTVQQMESVELPITVRLPDTPQIASSYKVNPDRMTLRLPSSMAQAANGLSLVARLDQVERLANLAPNTPHTRNVTLTLPPALSGMQEYLPRNTTVNVTFTIQRQTDTYVAPTVPIHINAPPLLLKPYDIDLPADKQVLADVHLSGPKEAIADIKSGKFKIWVEVRPSADDLEAQLRPDAKPLELHPEIPPGVSIDSPLPPVDLAVKRRAE